MKPINKINPEEFELPIIEVRRLGKEKEFELNAKEIKHIRRCLRNRINIYPSVFESDDHLTELILNKFLKIGFLDLIRNKESMKDSERKCAFEDCEEINELEIHHKNSISNGGNNSKDNLVYYCPLHHDYIELKNRLIRKKEEIKNMEKKLLNMESKISSRVLWYPC